MTRVYFKRHFHEAIRSGRKTTTLRRWAKSKVYPGQTIFSPGIGRLRVIACRQVKLDELVPADARADGFSSLAKLFAAVRRIYPNHKKDGRRWYRVEFQLTAVIEPAAGKRLARCRPVSPDPRVRFADAVRTELDKAVQRNGSLAAL
jgi:hypothetical protein